MMHDSFRDYVWDGFMTNKTKYPMAIFDTHIYYIFDSGSKNYTLDDYRRKACEAVGRVNTFKNRG